MPKGKGETSAVITIPSSEEEDQSEEHSSESELEEEEEEEGNNSDDDDYSVEEIGSSSPSADTIEDDDDDDSSESSEFDDQDYEDDSSENECLNDDNGDEFVSDRVASLLQEDSDLQELSLTECKAYLRRQGLRISGFKAECIERIREYWRIKDGNGEALYPRSSFAINCTGDVCKGDVVLFTQRVYEKFDKMTRRGNVLGKRTIAGRVVKESYGAAKQQHTFTVEALWSKGIKKLPPLFPLLVKGRNLYKLRTFRQRWKNETERCMVLEEKHKRGAAARFVRSMKKTNSMKNKKRKMASSTNAGAKCQKRSRRTNPAHQVRPPTTQKKGKYVHQRGKFPKRNMNNSNKRPEKSHPVRRVNSRQTTTRSRPHTSYGRDQNFVPSYETRNHRTFHSQYYPPLHFQPSHSDFQHQIAPPRFTSSEWAYTSSSTRLPHFRPHAAYSRTPTLEHQGLNHGTHLYHGYPHPGYVDKPSNVNRFPGLKNCQPFHSFDQR